MSDTWSMAHDPEGGFLEITFAEDFLLRDLDSVAQSLESEGHAGEHRLFNFLSHGGLAPTTTELLDLAKKSVNWEVEGVRVAWLAGTQTDAGLLRIITTKFSEQVMRVFTSEPEARRWLVGQSAVVQDSPGQVDHHPIRLRGEITSDDIIRAQQEVRATKGFLPKQPLLWDLRECRILESLDVSKEIAVFMAGNHNRDRQGYKSAILVDSHFLEMIVREMGRASELDQSNSIVVFRSYRDAMAWLAK